MRIFLITAFSILLGLVAKAQTAEIPDLNKLDSTENTNSKSSGPFTVEQEPEFRGGSEAFYNYLAKNIRYPKDSKNKRIEGKVYLSFVVDLNGKLTDIKILKGVSPDIDEEAIRLIKNSPSWIPGIQNGRTVRVLYKIHIDFKIT
jgi:TonB family protein